jgi:signal transduction histidine kinase
MFKSARIQLTFFYLVAIIFVSFLTTFGTRIVAENAFENQNSNARGQISQIVRQQVGLPLLQSPLERVQQKQDNDAHDRLLVWTIYFNIIAIVVGVPISYWFAGRTLRPIEDAHKLQEKFASDASHELNTPLSVMKTENEVFLRQKNFKESEARSLIVSNLEEIQRLELLTNNLLTLSDFANTKNIKMSAIDTNKITNDAISLLAKIYPDQVNRVKLNVTDLKVFGNQESLSQVIFIFLDNAIKYSPKTNEINLVGRQDNDMYVFSVIDEGNGINEADMPKIFERLYRGDLNRSSKIPGHGLGLALAKEIANANQAGLSVSNNSKKGATFNLIVNLYKK